MIQNLLTQKELKRQVYYDELTGIFTRKTSTQRLNVGDIVGYKNSRGYVVISISGVHFKAHRLAWLYVHGYFPENSIDHIDRIKYHNWILNLREVSKQCNMRNSWNSKANTSGIKGVCFDSKRENYGVSISSNYTRYKLGFFKDFDEAVCHRLAAEQCLNWNSCDSHSPAFQYVQKMQNRKAKAKQARFDNKKKRSF